MANIIFFPDDSQPRPGLERVKSTYSLREISRRFDLSVHYLRRWTDEGLIPTVPDNSRGRRRYDCRALRQFRRVRELRRQGLGLRQIDAELHGQLNLFPRPQGEIVELPDRLSPFAKALRLHELGDTGVREAYLKAEQEDDFAADACCNLGIWEFEAGRTAQALEAFNRALEHDPGHFETHFNLACLYFDSEDYRMARLHFRIAAEIEPGYHYTYVNLGLVHALTGNLEEAREALLAAREKVPREDLEEVEELLNTVEKALRRSHPPRDH